MTLPAFPPPREDELLTSFLIRLALANALRPTRLPPLLGLPTLWRRDPDRNATSAGLKVLAAATGLPQARLEETTLRPLMGRLHGEADPNALNRFLLHVDRHTRAAGARGHPVCPHCLAEGGVLVRAWRLTTTVMCERHGTPLVDHCARCSAPVSHIRAHLSDRGRHLPAPYHPELCSGCRQPLTAPAPLEPPGLKAALFLQGLLQGAAYTGQARWGELTLSGHEVQGVVECLSRLHLPPEAAQARKWRPEFAPVEQRLPMMTATGALMAGGLVPCVERLRERGIGALQVLARVPRREVPEWFSNVITDSLSRRPHARRLVSLTPGPYRFTNAQWARARSALPPEGHTGGGRGGRKGHREALEAFLTRHWLGTHERGWKGPVSSPTMNRRVRRLAQDGHLDGLIDRLLEDLPAGPEAPVWAQETREALMAPETVRVLERLGSRHTSTLWQLGVQQAARTLEEVQS
ncbi:TniQ family protein [Deinococcus aquatilis]|uniref:TniQ family protein n=1 Tax=Deinococcus aquatilis TaxID=519440 RepID=UPI000374FD6A|nr:TniQ family protein [Deinococcus aquatilis]